MMVQKQMVVAGQQRMAESVLENQMKGIELRERRFEKHPRTWIVREDRREY